ncbi:probable glutamate receptor [Limulus polyphemus]|uniref:Probable glutamate receptor n=1 Tax=Limulus polyphemus TaxID=6850 RepID=A0ABM1S2Q5_LIMPO|nr:probable glutamate receptor [Limulus polyphemus]
MQSYFYNCVTAPNGRWSRNTGIGSLRIAADQYLPYVRVSETEDTVQLCGPMANLLDMLSTYVPFRYAIYIPSDHKWGIRSENGTWNGMVGMLQREEVDLALGPFTVTYERNEIITFSYPLLMDSVVILTNRFEERHPVFQYFLALDWQVWMALFIALLIVAIIDAILNVFTKQSKSFYTQLANSIWNFVTCLLQQGPESTPRKMWNRFLFGAWWLVVMVVFSAFGGQLRALLLFKSSNLLIDNLEELVETPDLQPLILDGGSFHDVLQRSSEGTLTRRLLIRIEQGHGLLTHSQLLSDSVLDSVERGSHAVMTNLDAIRSSLSQRASTKNSCKAYIVDEIIFNQAYAVAFSKKLNRTLVEKFNKLISLVVGNGLLEKWIEEMVLNYKYCLNPEDGDVKPLKLKDLAGVILFLFGGYLVSALEADIAIGPFIPTYDRHEISEFSTPLYMASLAILTGQLSTINDYFAFFRVFERQFSNQELYQDLWKRMKLIPNQKEVVDEVLNDVQSGTHVLITDISSIVGIVIQRYNEAPDETCTFRIATKTFYNMPYVLCLSRNLNKDLSKALQKQ